ncbi:MAG: sialate O-acetylesterase [Blastochloris sp.]|nr:sialate O-acetylesterase [Blastochloris sp.]
MHHNLIILSGQSNASGRALWEEDLLRDQAVIEAEICFDCDSISSFQGIVSSGGDFRYLQPEATKVFGPEVGLIRALMLRRVSNLAVIKFSRGATNLHTDWNPESGSGHQLYRALLDHIRTACVSLEKRGHSFSLRGLAWMQGESDSSRAADYQQHLEKFLSRLRRDLGQQTLPVVIGRVAPTYHPGREEVRMAQLAIVETDPAATWVDTDDLQRFDRIHYDAAGTFELGLRMGHALVDLWERLSLCEKSLN